MCAGRVCGHRWLRQKESWQDSSHLMSPEGLLDEREKSWRSMVGVGVRTDTLPRTERAGGIWSSVRGVTRELGIVVELRPRAGFRRKCSVGAGELEVLDDGLTL